MDKETYIPIKLVVTQDRQIVNNVIRATNQQTSVLSEALESLTPFHRTLEDFYNAKNKSGQYMDHIYYERRSKQYAMDSSIKPKNIVSLTAQIKAFIGMFLNDPHSHPRYYGELLKAYEDKIFVDDHKPDAYYASGALLSMLEKRLNLPHVDRSYRAYRYHLLMILRILVGGYDVPRLNSRQISQYCDKIVEEVRNKGEPLFERAEEQLATSLERFYSEQGGRRSGERNPPHRLRLFTNALLGDLKGLSRGRGTAGNDQRPGVPGTAVEGSREKGKVKMFDDWRNFGFIYREGGGEIFFHAGSIKLLPWHLRVPGTEVRYRVERSSVYPDRLLAADVEATTK